MSQYNKERFYWIKLTDNFMSGDVVDFFMGQKDGANFLVIYQMLCLKTVNNGGWLFNRIGELIIPYDEEKIQRDLKWFSIDTIRVALSLYKQLGLIYEESNGMLKIADFENFVGSQTISAMKKQEQLKARSGKVGGIKVEKIPPYIEIDIDKVSHISRISRACAREEEVENIDNTALEDFLKAYPNVRKDLTVKLESGGYNWTALNLAFKESDWLQGVDSLQWIVSNYEKILSGKYKNFNARKTSHFASERNYNSEETDKLLSDMEKIEF